jgi:hypothetical protein
MSSIWAFIVSLISLVGEILKRFPAKTSTEKEGEVRDDVEDERKKQNETGRPVN